eukprot:scaffold87541_cov15-Prasinocladus_malaysianus.AAC.1
MTSLSAGDVQGLWLVISGYLVAPTAVLLAGNFALSVALGEGKLPVSRTTGLNPRSQACVACKSRGNQ